MITRVSNIPKSMKGFVLTETIIQDIKKFRIKSLGETPNQAEKRARTCIADFIKHVGEMPNYKRVIIQSQTPGRRQLAIDILGPWLHKRKKLKGFTSSNCPYKPPIIVEATPLPPVTIQLGQVLVNPPQTLDACHAELRSAMAQITNLQKVLNEITIKLKQLEDANRKRRDTNIKNASKRHSK